MYDPMPLSYLCAQGPIIVGTGTIVVIEVYGAHGGRGIGSRDVLVYRQVFV